MMVLPNTFEAWAMQSSTAETIDKAAVISWSDLPCQGDFLIDFDQLHFSPIDQTTASMDQKHGSPPPSPRSLSEELLCHCTLPSHAPHLKKKTVRFAEIAQIRTYDVILGDHPSCHGGMALQLDWTHQGTEFVHLDVYDTASRHRNMAQLHLTFFQRRERLRQLTGMSGCELLRAEFDLLSHQEMSPAILRRTASFL
ncbi:hypothetical protein FisN_9Lu117 [Fistulifera solaris]|uniref:Uncharacterized protein n=1 Tax=Fistulifera solaris TaxID=1519565 RepID=A0A1Z5KLM5_FISSO|nr:hypothetical protein FisN_9Lu117 [Fistulifera solaris]|eukprot:GAX26838.1 hypothetical protein FisN_9Lu117 [Fistulifera solaris]